MRWASRSARAPRSEEHTSELQSRRDLVCRLLLEKKKDGFVDGEALGQLLVFLVNRLAPRAKLFPYTTLFRSADRTRHSQRRPDRATDSDIRIGPHGADRRDRRRQIDPAGCAGPRARRALRDRKSTRLNSSHVETSYAVFCLKKKKTASSMERHWVSCLSF